MDTKYNKFIPILQKKILGGQIINYIEIIIAVLRNDIMGKIYTRHCNF